MGNKESQESREQRVIERVQDFLQRQDLDYYFGFSCDDVATLHEAFSGLSQNKEKTTFPDFRGRSSCVELFSVSSSAAKIRKGATQMRQDAELAAKIAHDDEETVKSSNYKTRTYSRCHPEHSYGDLTRNLRYQVEKHVKSKRSSDEAFDICVFVIDRDEADLRCKFWTPDDSVNLDGLRVGDLMPTYENGKRDGLYRLSRDKENLEWLAQYSDDVDYIVFCCFNTIETINLHHVKEIVAFLPWKLITTPAPAITMASSTPLSRERPDDYYEQD